MKYVVRLCIALSVFLATLVVPPDASAQERTIRGTVVEEATGQPVDFPQIAVQGTQIGAVGDEQGRFVLQEAPAGPVTLVVQRIGYRSAEVQVAAGEESVRIGLVIDHLRVEELVVTGRATRIARQNLAHSVATLTGEAVTETPQHTLDRSLQGKVPGAIVSANSGAPGGGLQVQLRGVTSINAASEPLYVVDGVLMSNVAIPSNQNAITAAASGSNPSLVQDNQVNRIADLNPEDIESIEILKGASAAAIYGSKAGNGVVIITTRRGARTAAPQFRARASGGFFDLSNTLGFRNFATVDEAVDAFGAVASDHFVPGQVFDQEKLLAGRNDFSWELSGSVSSGGDETQYYASALWKDDEGIIENTYFDRQSLRANLQQALGDRTTVNVNTGIIRTSAGRGLTNNDNSQTSYYMVYPSTPNFVDLRRQEDGTFPRNPFVGNGSNPLQTAALLTNDEVVYRLLGSANAEMRLIDRDRHGLRLNVQAGADWFNQENPIVSPPELHFEDQDGLLGSSLLSNSNNLNFNVGSNLIFNYSPGATAFTTSAGIAYNRQELRISRIVSQNLTGGKTNVDAGTQVGIRDHRELLEDFSFFVQQEMLALDDRLFLSAAAVFDQSSAAGDSSKVFAYPKAAASYRFPDFGGLDEMKVRAAVGQTGNRPLFGQKFTLLEVFSNIEGLPSFGIQGTVGDPNIEFERQTEVEAGVDLTAFTGRGTLELTGYHQWITNMILQRRVAPSTGFTTEIFNAGELRSWGFEAALGLTPVSGPDLTWVSRTSFSLTRSKIHDLPVPPFVTGGFGTSLGAFFVQEGESATQIVGTDPTCTSAEARPECRGVGLAKMGDANPDFMVSFGNDVSFGNFRLYGLLDWRQGLDLINLTELLFDAGQNSRDFVGQVPDGVSPAEHVNQCHPDCSGLERLLGFATGNPRGYVQAGSFLKIREVSLSYEVPEASVRRLLGGGLSGLRLTLSGRDLASVTPYSGLDPEVSNFGNQQIARNIDVAPFPPSRSFWLTADVRF